MRWRKIVLIPTALAAIGALSGAPVRAGRLPDSPLPLAGTHASAVPYMAGFAVASVSPDGKFRVVQLKPPGDTDEYNDGNWTWGTPDTVGGTFDRAAPVAVVKQNIYMHVFAYQKVESDARLISIYYKNGQPVKSGGNIVQQIVRYGGVSGAGGFGVAPVPDGSGVVIVMVDLGLQTAKVCYFTYAPGDDPALLIGTVRTIPLPTDLPPSYDGNISAAVTMNFDRMASWYPFRLTLALHPGFGAGDRIRTREYRLNPFIPESSRDRYFLTPIPGDDRWNTLGPMEMGKCIVMHEGMDGRVYIAGTSPTGPSLYTRTGFDTLTQAATWETRELDPGVYGYSGDVPGFTYYPVFTRMKDQMIPIDRVAFFNETSSQKIAAYTELFGQGKREDFDLSNTPSPAGLVVGIIDGPPPFDNKNLNLDPAVDPQSENKAYTKFATARTGEASVANKLEAGLSVGFTASTGVSYLGLDFGVEASVEMEATFGADAKVTVGDEFERTVTMNMVPALLPGGGYRVTPKGALILATMSFSGRACKFVDQDGNDIPGSRRYTQVWPSDMQFRPVEYWMNPNGRQPGFLQSYVLDQQAQDALGALSKIEFAVPGGNSTDHISYSWAGGTTVEESWLGFKSNQSTVSAAFSIKSAMKVSASAPVGSIEASVGSSLTASRAWEIGTTESVGLSTYEDVRDDPSAPGTYVAVAYDTYLLKDSNVYIRELLSDDPYGIGLVTSTWPPMGTQMRKENEDAKAQIIRTSKPWKITYVVTFAQLSDPASPAPGDPVLEPRLKAKLARYGIRTCGHMYLLLKRIAVQEAAPRPNIVEPWRVTRERRIMAQRLDEQLRNLPSGPFLGPVMRVLTPADRAAMRRYIEAVNAAERRRWLQSNPNRYPLFPPSSVRNAPDFNVPRPDYTRIPPPELPPR